jgi:hypothetical protein
MLRTQVAPEKSISDQKLSTDLLLYMQDGRSLSWGRSVTDSLRVIVRSKKSGSRAHAMSSEIFARVLLFTIFFNTCQKDFDDTAQN